MNFKLPFKLPTFGIRGLAALQATVLDVSAAKKPAVQEGAPRRLPLIGHLPSALQIQFLGAASLFFLVLLVFVLWQGIRVSGERYSHRAMASDLRVFSEVVSRNAVRLSAQGSPLGLRDIDAGRARFGKILTLMTSGGSDLEFSTSPIPGETRPDLDRVTAAWATLDKSLPVVIAQEKGLKALHGGADQADGAAASLAKLAAVQTATGEPARLAANATRRIRTALLMPPAQIAEAIEAAGQEVAALRTSVGTVRGIEDPERKILDQAVADLEAGFAAVTANLAALDAVKRAGIPMQAQADQLSAATERLFTALGTHHEQDAFAIWVIIVSGSLMMVFLVLTLKAFNDDAAIRRLESDKFRREAESARNATQEAILRLMNEMGDLADGDLTVRATVTEDVTGAIADSVNYTVEELSVLVRRINQAAGQVSAASDTAQNTSNQLLDAAERQSQEIQQTSQRVLDMAQSMSGVSARALQSARVARQSLDAAEKGAEAVENSIKGMNEIRGQIQETSKRIKRLGESSQEIGEIVELISDITEQTNVLALNAAIQAASAGEAGRGFTVVAEEVQRLAERSGEATKQIAAIVKTIQADTHDAVSAMEYSTQGVVEGAKLSDAAGQALEEISKVSQSLAELIAKISADTKQQADIATSVASNMEGILQVTDQTTEGTKRTAVSIGELADLATELKGSVSGFKV